jgi:hypothetical protein
MQISSPLTSRTSQSGTHPAPSEALERRQGQVQQDVLDIPRVDLVLARDGFGEAPSLDPIGRRARDIRTRRGRRHRMHSRSRKWPDYRPDADREIDSPASRGTGAFV